MFANIGDGAWVDADRVVMIAEERGPNGVGSVGVFLDTDDKVSVLTPIAEVAKRVEEARGKYASKQDE